MVSMQSNENNSNQIQPTGNIRGFAPPDRPSSLVLVTRGEAGTADAKNDTVFYNYDLVTGLDYDVDADFDDGGSVIVLFDRRTLFERVMAFLDRYRPNGQ